MKTRDKGKVCSVNGLCDMTWFLPSFSTAFSWMMLKNKTTKFIYEVISSSRHRLELGLECFHNFAKGTSNFSSTCFCDVLCQKFSAWVRGLEKSRPHFPPSLPPCPTCMLGPRQTRSLSFTQGTDFLTHLVFWGPWFWISATDNFLFCFPHPSPATWFWTLLLTQLSSAL